MRCERPVTLQSGVVVPCQKCPQCRRARAADYRRIARAGFERPGSFALLTLTAPNFATGAVHRAMSKHDDKPVRCPCGRYHARSWPLSGIPLNIGDYRYDDAALFNLCTGLLWNTVATKLRRLGIEYVACRELQRRLSTHIHVILRGDFDPDEVETMATATTSRRWGVTFGSDTDIRTLGGDGDDLRRTAAYVCKYVTKDVDEVPAAVAAGMTDRDMAALAGFRGRFLSAMYRLPEVRGVIVDPDCPYHRLGGWDDPWENGKYLVVPDDDPAARPAIPPRIAPEHFGDDIELVGCACQRCDRLKHADFADFGMGSRRFTRSRGWCDVTMASLAQERREYWIDQMWSKMFGD